LGGGVCTGGGPWGGGFDAEIGPPPPPPSPPGTPGGGNKKRCFRTPRVSARPRAPALSPVLSQKMRRGSKPGRALARRASFRAARHRSKPISGPLQTLFLERAASRSKPITEAITPSSRKARELMRRGALAHWHSRAVVVGLPPLRPPAWMIRSRERGGGIRSLFAPASQGPPRPSLRRRIATPSNRESKL
jgi:hypothetical protein